MRIVIDLQPYQSPFSATRGVGRYTRDLVTALLQRSRGHEIYLALNGAFPDSIERIRREFSGFLSPDKFLVWQNHLATHYAHNGALCPPKTEVVRAAEVIRETVLNSVQPDVIFATNLQEGFSDGAVTSVRRVPSNALYATTLHDLTPFHFAKELLRDDVVRGWYLEKVDAARTSDMVLTVSRCARDDIVSLLNVDPDKVAAVLSGYAQSIFNPEPVDPALRRKVLDRLGIPEDFIFYFGGNDICKNVDRLLQAFSTLPEDVRRRFPLVLGGRSFKHDPYGHSHVATHELIDDLDIGDTVLTPGFVDDAELPVLLKSCTCFVFPSTHEGFGLPALEAMACGAPVIGSNRSSVAEVIGNAEALFDPYDVESMAGLLGRVLEDGDLRGRVRQAGLVRAGTFSWERAADEVLDLFEQAVADREVPSGDYIGDPLRSAVNAVAPLVPALTEAERMALARGLDETFPPAGRPTLYVDVSTLVMLDDRTGIQRVTRAVAAGMLAQAPAGWDVELVWSTPHEQFFRAANAYKRQRMGRQACPVDHYIAFKPGDILLFLDQAPRMAINHAAYIRHLRSIGVQVYFYVHDLIPLQHPEWFSAGGVEEFGELMETTLLADGAICNSAATAGDVKTYVAERLQPGRLPYRIGYVHLGSEISESVPSGGLPPEAGGVLQSLKQRPSVAMIGTIEPRKGHRQALAAFETLWSQGCDVNLVIVGRWGWNMGEFDSQLRSHPEFGRRLFWLTGISDEYLELVYAASTVLLAASEAEGFGLPLIEAAHHGLPVLARDIPIFREVAGDHASYFPDSLEPAVLVRSIAEWLAAQAAGRHVRSDGMPTLSWSDCVRGMFDVLLGENWQYRVDPDGSINRSALVN